MASSLGNLGAGSDENRRPALLLLTLLCEQPCVQSALVRAASSLDVLRHRRIHDSLRWTVNNKQQSSTVIDAEPGRSLCCTASRMRPSRPPAAPLARTANRQAVPRRLVLDTFGAGEARAASLASSTLSMPCPDRGVETSSGAWGDLWRLYKYLCLALGGGRECFGS
ncbi:uncharacterized protein TrAtP1_005343 [Trichoderma atroviride]|uniref:uncharacterized protein n=1 Tax=Hypocrea atroviridis TaxID=63577 RepID=UPI003318CC78|nr:hypothetical protein TrAtP1_005343 [Trichoderma atroviride]